MIPRAIPRLLAMLAAGCGGYEVRPVTPASATPTPEAKDTTTGKVCVARLADEGVGTPVPVWDNAVLVGAATRSSHFCWAALPGRHFLTTELLVTAELTLDVRAGATSWVLMEADSSIRESSTKARTYRSGRRKDWVKLVPADGEAGEKWRAETAQIELVDVPTDQRPPPRTPIPASP